MVTLHPNPRVDPALAQEAETIWMQIKGSVEDFAVCVYDCDIVMQRWNEVCWNCLRKSLNSEPNILLFSLSIHQTDCSEPEDPAPETYIKLEFLEGSDPHSLQPLDESLRDFSYALHLKTNYAVRTYHGDRQIFGGGC